MPWSYQTVHNAALGIDAGMRLHFKIPVVALLRAAHIGIALARLVLRRGRRADGDAALLATAFLVGTEVAIRKLFNLSLGAADEISGSVFAVATAWAYAMVLRPKGSQRGPPSAQTEKLRPSPASKNLKQCCRY